MHLGHHAEGERLEDLERVSQRVGGNGFHRRDADAFIQKRKSGI